MSEHGFDPRALNSAIPRKHWHFHKRLFEHYRIVLHTGDFSSMLRDIAQGRAQLIESQGRGREVFHVYVPSAHERVFVVMASKRRMITVLPPSNALKKLRMLRRLEGGQARVRIVRKNDDEPT